jgi:hypothetical protein
MPANGKDRSSYMDQDDEGGSRPHRLLAYIGMAPGSEANRVRGVLLYLALIAVLVVVFSLVLRALT